MPWEAGHEHDLVPVQFLQVGGFAQRAADVQQIGRRLVDQLIGAHVVVRELQHLRRQSVIARVRNAAQIAQRFQRVDQALRRAAVQARGTRNVGQRHVAFRAVEGVQHLEGFFGRAYKERRPGLGRRLRLVRIVGLVFGHGSSLFERRSARESEARAVLPAAIARIARDLIVIQLLIADPNYHIARHARSRCPQPCVGGPALTLPRAPSCGQRHARLAGRARARHRMTRLRMVGMHQ